MNDNFQIWAVIGSVFIAVFFLAWGISVFDCKTYKESTGKEVKLEYGTCYVKSNGEWFSKDQIRGVK